MKEWRSGVEEWSGGVEGGGVEGEGVEEWRCRGVGGGEVEE